MALSKAPPASPIPSPTIEVIDLEDSIDEIISLETSNLSPEDNGVGDLSIKSNEELFILDRCDAPLDESVTILEPVFKKGKWKHVPQHLKDRKKEDTEQSDIVQDDTFSQLRNVWNALPSSSNGPFLRFKESECIVLDDSEDEVVVLESDDEKGNKVKTRKKRKRMGVCSGLLNSDKGNKDKENKKENSPPPSEPVVLRPIVIDGCNVAFGHGKDKFSSQGLKICAEYFKKKGHKIKIFVPQFRRRHFMTSDHHILDELEKEGILCYTPSRKVDGKLLVSYDDRFIVEYAANNGGIIVTRDNYRDLLSENPEWTETINKRLLLYTWVDDTIMFPHDPLGRNGPSLSKFLAF